MNHKNIMKICVSILSWTYCQHDSWRKLMHIHISYFDRPLKKKAEKVMAFYLEICIWGSFNLAKDLYFVDHFFQKNSSLRSSCQAVLATNFYLSLVLIGNSRKEEEEGGKKERESHYCGKSPTPEEGGMVKSVS